MNEFDTSEDESIEEALQTLDVDWIDFTHEECLGKLGLSALPGCRFQGIWRNLPNDLAYLKQLDVNQVFTLCTKAELRKYRVPNLLQKLDDAGFYVSHFPFEDGDIPPGHTLVKLLQELRLSLREGKRCLIHCFGGIGRSCLVASCLLLSLDDKLEADDVIAQMRLLRGPGAIQSVKQYNFLREYRHILAAVDTERASDEHSRSISR